MYEILLRDGTTRKFMSEREAFLYAWDVGPDIVRAMLKDGKIHKIPEELWAR